MRLIRLALVACVPFGVAQAQDTVNVAKDTVPRRSVVVGCAGQRITDIVVVTQPPYTDKLPRSMDFLRRGVRVLHSNTQDDVIRKYLLLEVGDQCNEVRRMESERILRAQPFLVDARISALDDENGGIRLEVQTRDEFSMIAQFNASLRSPMLSGMRIGEGNLAGAGVMAAVQWRDGRAYHDLLGFRVEDYQFAGPRNLLRVHLTRGTQGHDYGIEMLRPYFTDLQRFGWRAKVGGTREYARFLRPGLEGNALSVKREFEDAGIVMRVGNVGRLKLVGVSLSREMARTDLNPVQITSNGFRKDTMGAIPSMFRPQDVARVNALLGFRRLRFERVLGFDALTGVQDMRVGVQVGTLFGHSVGWVSSRDNDMFTLGDLYAGYGSGKSFVGMQTLTEARRDRTTHRWDGVLTSGRMAWYLRPATKQLTLTEVLWASGTSVRVPYQLSFGDMEGGMHGYRDTRIPGAHRVVLKAEQRVIIPTKYNVADGGLALFAEVGKLWAGNVAYSRASPVRGSVGVGLLAAVPPKSRHIWRVDFAAPVGRDPDARFEIRFSGFDRTRSFWRDPNDVARARERAVPTSIFSWP